MLWLISARWVLALALVAVSAGAVAAELTFDIRIEHGRIPDAMRLMRVHEGDMVRLRWTSDRPLVLHLHGYDIEQPVAPDAVTEFAFAANATGRFPIELHAQVVGGAAHSDAALAIVEVYPR